VKWTAAILLSTTVAWAATATGATTVRIDLDEAVAARFADLALECVHKEYPNHVSLLLNSDEDARPPRKLTPVFYGCYDWHSAVHGHWLLVRLTRLLPDSALAPLAREALKKNITPSNVADEVVYFSAPGRVSFERPYGLAWLLQLAAELREWDDPDGRAMAAALAPLERIAADRIADWLPKLTHPIRIGEHSQTAFAMGLILDWARSTGDGAMVSLIVSRAQDFYIDDQACPLAYEPSGHDFLSPCIAEADLMRRVLDAEEFARWLTDFLPQIPRDGAAGWLQPGRVTDPSDPKLAHLDGLNLSRAWMLEGMAAGLPRDDERVAALAAAARAHAVAGLASVTGEHYEGGHWLGSFATYLVTGRGLPLKRGGETG
jgi:hypothetical protein